MDRVFGSDGFIGSSAMIFLPARLQPTGEALLLRLGSELVFPIPATHAARYRASVGKDLIFGLRPRSRNSRSIFGRPARCRDFQRQNALKPARCQRRIVSGFTTWDKSSRFGQTRVIHTNNARSLPSSRRRDGARRKAMLS